MTNPNETREPPTFLTVGEGETARRIATLVRAGDGPPVVWLGGFRSDMRATKAEALDAWAKAQGRAFVRFDYMGHGESGGRFEDATLSTWIEDALAVIAAHAPEGPILVGSSMGGWVSLLAVRRLAEGAAGQPRGLVLIAPAADFTEALMWAQFPEAVRETILRDGVWYRHSEYAPEPYPITRALIEDGRRHLILDSAPIPYRGPVRILQGLEDPDVPWQHALRVTDAVVSSDIAVTLIKGGDHRLSGEADLARLVDVVAGIA